MHYRQPKYYYFERLVDVLRAITREKQIKGLLRIRKIALIVPVDPSWNDIS